MTLGFAEGARFLLKAGKAGRPAAVIAAPFLNKGTQDRVKIRMLGIRGKSQPLGAEQVGGDIGGV